MTATRRELNYLFSYNGDDYYYFRRGSKCVNYYVKWGYLKTGAKPRRVSAVIFIDVLHSYCCLHGGEKINDRI